MPDNYPHEFPIEIDREGLHQYEVRTLRSALSGILGVILSLVAVAVAGNILDNLEIRPVASLVVAIGIFPAGIGLAILAAMAVSRLIVPLFDNKLCQKRAQALHVSVEGPFLRIRSGCSSHTDRKLHFRAITDYSVLETRDHRRCGIKSLVLSTTAGGTNSIAKVPGIKNCLEVRDLLAEIDAQREYGYPSTPAS